MFSSCDGHLYNIIIVTSVSRVLQTGAGDIYLLNDTVSLVPFQHNNQASNSIRKVLNVMYSHFAVLSCA